MRKSLIFIMLLALCFAFGSCGSSETADEPAALSYTDIQYETIRLYQVGIYNDDFVLTDELE